MNHTSHSGRRSAFGKLPKLYASSALNSSSRLRSTSSRRQGRLCAPQMLLRRGRGDQLLEARIIPERIEHWIESEQRRSNRNAIRYLQQTLENGNRVIGIPQKGVDARHYVLFFRAPEWIFGSGIYGHSCL